MGSGRGRIRVSYIVKTKLPFSLTSVVSGMELDKACQPSHVVRQGRWRRDVVRALGVGDEGRGAVMMMMRLAVMMRGEVRRRARGEPR